MSPQEIEVPLSQIEIDPDNVRSAYDPDIVAGLRKALQVSSEYINPPIVYPVGPNRYRVKHGSTRVLAAQGVLKSMRVRVGEPPASESTKLLSQMSENLLQGSLRPADVGAALKRLRNAEGKERSISQLVGALKAAGIDRTKAWVSMHLALAELAPEVRALINSGRLAAEAGYALRSLPPSDQVSWAHRVVEQGLTREVVRRELGLGSDTIDTPPELGQRDLDSQLGEAAQAFAEREAGQRQRRPADVQRHNSEVSVRRELVPISLDSADARKLRPLNTAAWARTATDVEKQLAQEALFIGGCSASEAIELVERATDEAQHASQAVMQALNAVRTLVEHPAELPAGSALAEFLAMRMRRALQNIGRL